VIVGGEPELALLLHIFPEGVEELDGAYAVYADEPPLGFDVVEVAVVIDPGRAFGTGAHATTRLCLELLQDVEPTSLLDVGCGSGVLSVAAAKLGFPWVAAFDIDDVALETTAANASGNGVAVDVVAELRPAKLAVMNIALDVVETMLPRLPVERAITSGYLDRDRPDVDGWSPVERRERDGWAADLLERR
jgi:ribosomal protein L11 methyltransferase